jgi:hypothetical protein
VLFSPDTSEAPVPDNENTKEEEDKCMEKPNPGKEKMEYIESEPVADKPPSPFHFELRLDEDLDSDRVEDFIVKPRIKEKSLANPSHSNPMTRSKIANLEEAPTVGTDFQPSPTWSMSRLLKEVHRRAEGVEDFGKIPEEEEIVPKQDVQDLVGNPTTDVLDFQHL